MNVHLLGLFPPKKSRGKTPSISRRTQRHSVMWMTMTRASSSPTSRSRHPASGKWSENEAPWIMQTLSQRKKLLLMSVAMHFCFVLPSGCKWGGVLICESNNACCLIVLISGVKIRKLWCLHRSRQWSRVLQFSQEGDVYTTSLSVCVCVIHSLSYVCVCVCACGDSNDKIDTHTHTHGSRWVYSEAPHFA